MSSKLLSALFLLLFAHCGMHLLAADEDIKFMKFVASFTCSKNFLLSKKDYFIIQFEIAKENESHPLDSNGGPNFYYTRNGSHVFACSGFDNVTGNCTDRAGIPDACSCQMQSAGVYRLSFNKTTDILDSKEYVYLSWADAWLNSSTGPNLTYQFPEVRASGGGFSHLEMALICALPIAGTIVLGYIALYIEKKRKSGYFDEANHAPSSSFYSLEYTRRRIYWGD
ncbi:hypothetical protein ElyMa_001396500 [Elysia marginata]|uniref:Intimal thickness related receptor IRP domain-containing protein n=1 Tax=Elysia marginata TaxID=1093978 RepID=A0AAV4ITA0_9GAST|nr:hypothetical protein ElyMa_001396500 [Elysia marginata]